MKAVLISICPEWCEKIAMHKKTIEIRKTVPKKLKPPFRCYIYCTKEKTKGQKLFRCKWQGTVEAPAICFNKANGKVIGEFICDDIGEFGEIVYGYGFYYFPWNGGMPETCLTEEQMWEYGKGKILYGWHISDLVIYDEPKELSEFYTECCPYLHNKTCYCNELCAYQEYNEHGDIKPCIKEVKRPPQSWCYVESEVTESD